MYAKVEVNKIYIAITALEDHIEGRVDPKYTVSGLTSIKKWLEKHVPERWDDKRRKWVKQDFPKAD